MSAPFTSALAQELAPALLERFCRYVRVDTQSRRDRERSPSTPGQLRLADALAAELREAGLSDARVDQNGYVMASLPASGGADPSAPAIGLIAHMDTALDASGSGVEPIVHRCYDGGVIELPRAGTRLDPSAMQELASRAGHDLITASGDTLLGADDKAGVAEIVSAVAHLAAHPELPRPPLRVAFTPDEEIGEGATLFDIEGFGAAVAYTLDGSGLGELQDETFSALEAIVTVTGVDVHPGFARGKMASALRLAARIVAALPENELTPDVSGEREGFIHPTELAGTVAKAEIRVILRDFDDELLDRHAALLERVAHEVVDAEPRASVEVTLREQYRNMRRHIDAQPRAIEAAAAAMRAEGIEPLRRAIRGGTDGSRLSERGLPTPNIFTGGHDFHCEREWASLQEMAAAAAVLVRLAGVWAGDGGGSSQRGRAAPCIAALRACADAR